MALAAHEVKVMEGEDHIVGVERTMVVDHEQGIGGHVENRVVVDKERGIAANVKKTTVAVDLGGGNVGVLRQERVTGVRAAVPNVSMAYFTVQISTRTLHAACTVNFIANSSNSINYTPLI